jgi:hypothetical protein
MLAFKLTSWNAEWLTDCFDVARGAHPPGSRAYGRKRPSASDAGAKLAALRAEILEMNPDILCLLEAIPGAADMQAFQAAYLPEYVLVTRPGDDATYGIRGEQWIWFLVKPNIAAATSPSLLDIGVWQAYTQETSGGDHAKGKWHVSAPALDKDTQTAGPNARLEHSHYRHPQVLVLNYAGTRVEIIGAHLKSKHIGMDIPKQLPGEDRETYLSRPDMRWALANAHVARAKLSSEATDVRYYIDKRFEQEALPIIFMAGDFNDGPGKELLEREYLLHDLIGNLQGDVFFARKFMNHALFDYPQDLRWTTQFADNLDPARSPRILLDHIIFTEALSRRGIGPLLVEPNSGLVEHEIHDRINSPLSKGAKTSDHKPVSLAVAVRPLD